MGTADAAAAASARVYARRLREQASRAASKLDQLDLQAAARILDEYAHLLEPQPGVRIELPPRPGPEAA